MYVIIVYIFVVIASVVAIKPWPGPKLIQLCLCNIWCKKHMSQSIYAICERKCEIIHKNNWLMHIAHSWARITRIFYFEIQIMTQHNHLSVIRMYVYTYIVYYIHEIYIYSYIYIYIYYHTIIVLLLREIFHNLTSKHTSKHIYNI